ncbi:MAG TPA: hypothetical protein VJA26_15875 [Gammaproteobacteria bacterium]|nr:hypothetical protein [Gammaproteobacteria bacterium]
MITPARFAAGALILMALAAQAQPPPAAPAPAQTARESAALDFTGQWVAIVNEDWRWRMVTPPKGDYASVPLNSEGRRIADLWEPAQDGSCAAYGAAGLMRMPTRLQIDWDGDETLQIETDAGQQTRRLNFDRAAVPGARSLQGHSAAQWVRPLPPPGGPGLGGAGGGRQRMGGYLKVTTTNLLPGWLRRNGVPYSEDAVLTEYFDRFRAPNGDEWLMVTAIVEDPKYLNTNYVTSSHFRRDAGGAAWNPQPCRAT